jgi:hypothetical protein
VATRHRHRRRRHAIPVTIWTKIDDDGQPFNRKDPIDLRLHLDTGGAARDVRRSAVGHADRRWRAPAGVLPCTSGATIRRPSRTSSPHPVTATDVTWAFDGDVEVYAMTPLVTTRRPLGVKSWDSGPIDLGRNELTWLRGMRIKVKAGADLTVTPYFDAFAFPAVTVVIGAAIDAASVFDVWMPRTYKGRVPRLVITSTSPFYPYWIQPILRSTGAATAKAMPRIPIAANQVMS